MVIIINSFFTTGTGFISINPCHKDFGKRFSLMMQLAFVILIL